MVPILRTSPPFADLWHFQAFGLSVFLAEIHDIFPLEFHAYFNLPILHSRIHFNSTNCSSQAYRILTPIVLSLFFKTPGQT